MQAAFQLCSTSASGASQLAGSSAPTATTLCCVQPRSLFAPKRISVWWNCSSPSRWLMVMQLMPATAAHYGVTNRRDPTQNLMGGTRYLAYLLKLFDNDLTLALAAYNAGEGAVQRYGNKIPPYRETQNYVRKVLAFYRQARATRS